MKRATQNIDLDRAWEVLGLDPRACLSFVCDHGPQAEPIALVWQDGRYLTGVPELAEHRPAVGQEVVLLVDGGVHFFDLCAISIRGRAEPAEAPRDAPAGRTWFEVVPVRTGAWHFGALRTVSDES